MGLKNVENNGRMSEQQWEREGAIAARMTYHVVVLGRIQGRFSRVQLRARWGDKRGGRLYSVDVATVGGRLIVGCFREEGRDVGPAEARADI